VSSKPSRKKIIEAILTTEGWQTANAEIARFARTRYEVDLDSQYVSSVKRQLKKQQAQKQSEAHSPMKEVSSSKTTPQKQATPTEEKSSSQRRRVVTLDDVKEVEQAIEKAGLDLQTALVFVRSMNQPLETAQEVLEWLCQRQK